MKTLQQKQKSLEYKETRVFGPSSHRQINKQPDVFESVTLEQTSDTLSFDCKDPLLSSVKPQCLSDAEQTGATNIKSCARKLVESRAILTSSSPGSDVIQNTRLLSTMSEIMKETVKPLVKTSKGKSRSKNVKTSKPFIEHQEDKSTSFSRTNFVTLQERLSSDEMHILSQLALALSLPDDVRRSLHAYLDRQKALDDGEQISVVGEGQIYGIAVGDHIETSPAAKSKKRKKASKKLSVSEESVAMTSAEPFWNAEDVKDSEKLKMSLEQATKLLSCNKRLLLERAVEHENQMKENAYHEKMASFVELCINTGMVICNYLSSLFHILKVIIYLLITCVTCIDNLAY